MDTVPQNRRWPRSTWAAQDAQSAIEVVYEDESLLVVVKPSGLVVHPACGHARNAVERPGAGICRARSSRPPSAAASARSRHVGSVMCSQAPRGAPAPGARPAAWAIREAIPGTGVRHPAAAGAIDVPMGRDPLTGAAYVREPTGRQPDALRGVAPLEPVRAAPRVLETGRTHQIRVHLCTPGSRGGRPRLWRRDTGMRSSLSARRPPDVPASRFGASRGLPGAASGRPPAAYCAGS